MRKVLSTWLRGAALTLLVLGLSSSVSLAQVTIAVNDISGRPGESATVSVDLSGVEAGTAIQSYNLTVGTATGNVVLAGIDYGAGTLAGDTGFSNADNAGAFPTAADVTIGGFSTGTDISTSGTLLILTFNFVATGTDTITLTGTTFNAGDPAAMGDFAAAVISSNRFLNASMHSVLTTAPDFVIEITAEDAFTAGDNVISFSFGLTYDPAVVSLGTATPGDLNGGWTMNQSGAAGAITVASFFSGVNMTGAGVIARIPATGLADGTTTLDLNSVVFNAGSPIYADRDGWVNVTFVAANVPPVAGDIFASTSNFDPVDITLFATDADGGPSALSYAVVSDPANGSVSISGDVATYQPDFPFTGDDTFTYWAFDGEDNSNIATVLVESDALGEAHLAGVNEVPFVSTPGFGYVEMEIYDDVVFISGVFANLSGDYASSHIHWAGVGENGGVIVSLTPLLQPDGRNGEFSEAFDLAANPDLRDAIFSSEAYVNVHTSAYGPGEIRGQILQAPNVAPPAALIRSLSEVVIVGAPDARLFSVSWLPVTDANFDTVHYIYQMAADAAFTDILEFEPFFDGNGFRLTVEETAAVYDDLTDADPGNVNIGGSIDLWHRIITTDGSKWTAGPAVKLTLTRGLVTSNEGELELPTEFALLGNYPNPFNPTTSIQFDLPETADVTITVTDMLGRQVLSVPTRSVDAGANRSIQIQAGGLSSGLYLYRVIAQGNGTTFAKTGTMTLIK